MGLASIVKSAATTSSIPDAPASVPETPPAIGVPVDGEGSGSSVISSMKSLFVSASAPPAAPGKYMAAILGKIKYIRDVNNFHGFYSDEQLSKIAHEASQSDLDALAAKMKFPSVELAIELAAIALYDVVILADDSGSMLMDKERVEDLQFIISQAVEIATKFDADGISLRTFKDTVRADNVKTVADVDKSVAKMRFNGSTPIGPAIRSHVLEPMLFKPAARGSLKKPVLVLVVTDGAPDNKGDVVNAVASVGRTLGSTKYGTKAVAFQFAQVGRDRDAQAWLGEIDADPEIGGIIDATSYFEHEQEEYSRKGVDLTPYLWILKLMMGAIDPKYDSEDEV